MQYNLALSRIRPTACFCRKGSGSFPLAVAKRGIATVGPHGEMNGYHLLPTGLSHQALYHVNFTIFKIVSRDNDDLPHLDSRRKLVYCLPVAIRTSLRDVLP
jgi:hypothetical protein